MFIYWDRKNTYVPINIVKIYVKLLNNILKWISEVSNLLLLNIIIKLIIIVKVMFNKRLNITEFVASFLLYFSTIKFKENNADKKVIPDKFKDISNAFRFLNIIIFDIVEMIALKQKRPDFPKNR